MCFFPFLVFSAVDKFIVCQRQLLSLFTVCPTCCGETQGHIMHPEGTFIKVKQVMSYLSTVCEELNYSLWMYSMYINYLCLNYTGISLPHFKAAWVLNLLSSFRPAELVVMSVTGKTKRRCIETCLPATFYSAVPSTSQVAWLLRQSGCWSCLDCSA